MYIFVDGIQVPIFLEQYANANSYSLDIGNGHFILLHRAHK